MTQRLPYQVRRIRPRLHLHRGARREFVRRVERVERLQLPLGLQPLGLRPLGLQLPLGLRLGELLGANGVGALVVDARFRLIIRARSA